MTSYFRTVPHLRGFLISDLDFVMGYAADSGTGSYCGACALIKQLGLFVGWRREVDYCCLDFELHSLKAASDCPEIDSRCAIKYEILKFLFLVYL